MIIPSTSTHKLLFLATMLALWLLLSSATTIHTLNIATSTTPAINTTISTGDSASVASEAPSVNNTTFTALNSSNDSKQNTVTVKFIIFAWLALCIFVFNKVRERRRAAAPATVDHGTPTESPVSYEPPVDVHPSDSNTYNPYQASYPYSTNPGPDSSYTGNSFEPSIRTQTHQPSPPQSPYDQSQPQHPHYQPHYSSIQYQQHPSVQSQNLSKQSIYPPEY